jgi:hypothetical protein
MGRFPAPSLYFLRPFGEDAGVEPCTASKYNLTLLKFFESIGHIPLSVIVIAKVES